MSNRRRLARERLEYYLVYLILAYRHLILIVGLLLLVFAMAHGSPLSGDRKIKPCHTVNHTRKDACKQTNTQDEIRSILQKFRDGYTAREIARLDEFMQLFAPNDETEMIGIGAAKRAATEWFEGHSRIREIVESDWRYWGDVKLDVNGAKITANGKTAWLSTTGTVTQTQAFDTAIGFHLNDMKAIFDQEGLSADEKLMEATHYGMRRLRERSKGIGHGWPFTFTAVLVKVEAGWRFHTIHWAMPVD